MLDVENLHAGYRRVRVLHDVTLSVATGETIGVLGPNGAGKTTLLRAIAGICSVYGGRIVFAGQPLDGKPDYERAALGIAHVPEGRRVWPSLTVKENLLMGAWRLASAERKRELQQLVDYVIDHFPRLHERLEARAAVLSGGEQQMLAIARAMMSRPRLLLLDEPSLGLAPQLVEEIFAIVERLNREEKVSFLVAEQNTKIALRYAEYGYILENGRIVMDGAAANLRANEDVKEFYLGLSASGRKSYRDVKHYRRRKRWLA